MKRKLPASEVVHADYGTLPKRPETRNTRRVPIADELNKQRPRPVYDEFRKRRDYRVGED